jgi:hypothetical protein
MVVEQAARAAVAVNRIKPRRVVVSIIVSMMGQAWS